jgi:LysM repeat protein
VQLEPFIDFAKKAVRGTKLMFQSHSSIIPPGFASTREVSNHMVAAVGGKMRKSKRSDVLGLQMFERYDSGGYHVRGYHGDDKPDHCAHLGLMKDVVKVHINRRWKSPEGRKGKQQIAAAKVEAKKTGAIHMVESGDHLTGIAKRYGTSVQALRDANGLTHGDPIRIGQELAIPAASAKAKSPNKTKPEDSPRPGEKTHVVADGHSLGRIAKRYNVTVNAIRDRNGLEKGGRKIQPGDRLIIPKK